MRVGLVSPYSLTIFGGVQGQVLGLARSLRAMGHQVRVLGPCDGAPPEVGIIPLGNSIPTAANGSVAPLAPDPACALRTIRALRDEAFDVLHLHEPMVPGPCMTTSILKPAPLVGTFHRAGDGIDYKVGAFALRFLVNRLDTRCVVSDDALELAGKHFSGVYERLYNGVEIEHFAKATPSERDERPTVFFLGRHEERKGLAVLLEAMPHLPANVRVWVAGDGPQRESLVASHTDERIEWLGRIDDDEKASRLRAADVYCAPSLHGESFGIVLLEAMAAGTPVVASDLPGYAKVARANREALLVPPGDPRALGAAITRVLGDSNVAASLVEGGRARAEELSMDRLSEKYLEIYDRVITARRTR